MIQITARQIPFSSFTFLLAVVGLTSALLFFTNFEFVLGLAGALLFGFIVLFGLVPKLPTIGRLLVAAYIVRICIALVQAYVTNLPSASSDAAVFENLGWIWAQEGFFKSLEYLNLSRSYVYAWVIAAVYSITGRSPLLIQIINCFVGTLTVFYTYKTTLLLWNKQTAKVAAITVAFLPPMLLFSAIMLREALIAFFIIFGTYYVLRWYKQRVFIDFLIGITAFALSGFFHGAMFLFVPALCISYLWTGMCESLSGNPKAFFLLILGTLIFTGGISWGIKNKVGMSKLASLYEGDQKGQAIVGRVTDFDHDTRGAAMHANIEIESFSDLILHTPRFLIYFLYAPFPHMISRIYDLERVVISFFCFLLTIGLFLYRKQLFATPGTLTLFVIFAVLVLAFALGSRELATAYRHKAKFLAVWVSFSAPFLVTLGAWIGLIRHISPFHPELNEDRAEG